MLRIPLLYAPLKRKPASSVRLWPWSLLGAGMCNERLYIVKCLSTCAIHVCVFYCRQVNTSSVLMGGVLQRAKECEVGLALGHIGGFSIVYELFYDKFSLPESR